MLSKSLIQFSVDGRDYVPSLLFALSPKYGGGKEDNSDLLQKAPCRHCYTQCPQPAAGHVRFTSPPDTPGHTRASLGQSLVGLPLQVPWVLVHTSFCLCPLRVCFPSPFFKFWWLCGGVNGHLLQEGLCHIQFYCNQRP